MIRLKKRTILNGLKPFDLILMISAFALSAWIAHYEIDQVSFEELVTMRMKIQNFILFISIGWVWLWVFTSFGLYQSNRLSLQKFGFLNVLKATTVGTLIIYFYSYIFKITLITTTFIWLFWAISSVFCILIRIFFRYLLYKFWKGSNEEITNGIRSRKVFIKIIEKERIRANRENHKYSIILFSLDGKEENYNDVGILLQTITGRIRRIDEIGWYDNKRVGVMLPNTTMEGACRLAENICASMENVSKKTVCDIYTYPFDKKVFALDEALKKHGAA